MKDIDLPPVQRLTGPDATQIAHRYAAGRGPLIVFLPGYMSDMAGGKATAVMSDAMARGRACLLLDYSGCGLSDGDFADGTLSRWRDEVLALIEHVGGGPVVLAGSSMGGWLMLLIAKALIAKGTPVHALVGIAAAPDFIDWGYSKEQTATLERGEIWYEDNIYGPEPTPYHPAFHADAKGHLLLSEPIELTCPVRLLHGQNDPDVPWQTSLMVAEKLTGDDVHIHLVKDGDHRLSRESDIALLLSIVREVAA
ncbi:alpha/beta fold hydrolase [Croceicoccus naphthovorans]|uniref:Palmitoyl-protein thioesterase ABHD10, mitochondrial n=1 Tax=Croceicoccus naphthovorans TaxID=1348774 RepID=A0A0G3XEA2_9SPHN|nr:alpha/beta hydrolase [Croceicoccus naphthovorans]AKM08971.1 alpha/beta hydrolase [Croceicoccus naphthovorans]MBB3989231.1 pimeloyl-ACP methyl ester carboxylesterase [Croceicoccus naphthovorans]